MWKSGEQAERELEKEKRKKQKIIRNIREA
jgi:hypothetical protein